MSLYIPSLSPWPQSYNVLCVDVADKKLGPQSDPRNLFLPGTIEYFQADVSDPDAIAAAVDQAIAIFPSLNVLVNNVAVQHATSDCGTKQGASNVYSHELSMDSWNYQHAVNVGRGANPSTPDAAPTVQPHHTFRRPVHRPFLTRANPPPLHRPTVTTGGLPPPFIFR